jgi:putative oxidoreductase
MKKFKNPDVAILILRIFIGAVFITHGVLKLTHIADIQTFFRMIELAPWMAILVGVVEVLAGLSMILGYFTFASAIAITIIMLVAIFKVKLNSNAFAYGILDAEIELSLIISSIVVFLTGPGKYSLGNKCGCIGNCGCDKSACSLTDACQGKACDMGNCSCDCHKQI